MVWLLSVCYLYVLTFHRMVWYGMVGPDQSLAIIMVGPLGRVGQRLLLRVVLLAPNQIIVRLNLGPRIALGEVKYRLKIKGTTTSVESGKTRSGGV